MSKHIRVRHHSIRKRREAWRRRLAALNITPTKPTITAMRRQYRAVRNREVIRKAVARMRGPTP